MGKTPEAARLLRTLREETGQSLRRTADELGVTASYLSRLERGQRATSEGFARRAAGYYGVDVEIVDLDRGHIPEDVARILSLHPEVMQELRDRFGSDEDQ